MFCDKCGTVLIKKQDGIDGDVDYCPQCLEFHYKMFSSAVSAIIKKDDEILLVKQYGKDNYILVAGYVSMGECLEEALVREIKEETNLDVLSYTYNESRYYGKSNTLISNFIVEVTGDINPNDEIDSYEWFSVSDVMENIYKNSFAEYFFKKALEKKIVK